MKKTNLIILVIISIVSLASCASFNNKISKKESIKLTKETIHNINGTYEFQPFKSFGASGKRVYDIDTDTESIDFYILGTRLTFGPKSSYTVDVRVISKNEISFTFKNKDTLVFETTIKMKLRSNGLVYLKNKHVKVKGIPFVFGGITSNKMRIGLSKEGNLLLNYAYDSFASILIMAGGNSYNRSHHYKKINTLP